MRRSRHATIVQLLPRSVDVAARGNSGAVVIFLCAILSTNDLFCHIFRQTGGLVDTPAQYCTALTTLPDLVVVTFFSPTSGLGLDSRSISKCSASPSSAFTEFFRGRQRDRLTGEEEVGLPFGRGPGSTRSQARNMVSVVTLSVLEGSFLRILGRQTSLSSPFREACWKAMLFPTAHFLGLRSNAFFPPLASRILGSRCTIARW